MRSLKGSFDYKVVLTIAIGIFSHNCQRHKRGDGPDPAGYNSAGSDPDSIEPIAVQDSAAG